MTKYTALQSSGKLSQEGFTPYPLERLSYDEELDFDTRTAEKWEHSYRGAMKRRYKKEVE